MYEWIAVFERHEIVPITGGEEDVVRRITKRGTTEAQYGQDVVSAIILNEKHTGNMIQLQMREVDVR